MSQKTNNIEQKIICAFLENYKAKWHLREIARKTKISPQTAHRYLNALEMKNILKTEYVGKNKNFFLNKENIITKHTVLKSEIEKTSEFLKNHPKIHLILEQLNPKKAIIFGSYAKSTETKDSDIDMILFEKTSIKKITELEITYNLEINTKNTTTNEFKKLLKQDNALAIEVLKNHIIFSGFDDIVNLFWEKYYG
ncbi:MAG: nucleotidyltransferase domain-containing protein [Candidatus Aenigmarchaeota archaeon]|nr:nucleotidyltransferase domain-containing protein [Candidatus Aenigmarchaeota archaeon]